MRLRDISERIREVIETEPERFIGGQANHALIQEIQDVQLVYRPVAGASRKEELLPWLAFTFEPFGGLLEPFGAYAGRFWALQRMHRQPSGLPELLTWVGRDLPSAAEAIAPDLFVSFSHSPKVESVIRKRSGEDDGLVFFHTGALMEPDRTCLPAEFCLPGIADALPEGFVEDGIPGLVDLDGQPLLFLGDLVFYNGFRTVDRIRLRSFLLNCAAVGLVTRYVRDIVRKTG
ncbi:MAG: hypothetical protein R3F60_05515 [bacterium]